MLHMLVRCLLLVLLGWGIMSCNDIQQASLDAKMKGAISKKIDSVINGRMAYTTHEEEVLYESKRDEVDTVYLSRCLVLQGTEVQVITGISAGKDHEVEVIQLYEPLVRKPNVCEKHSTMRVKISHLMLLEEKKKKVPSIEPGSPDETECRDKDGNLLARGKLLQSEGQTYLDGLWTFWHKTGHKKQQGAFARLLVNTNTTCEFVLEYRKWGHRKTDAGEDTVNGKFGLWTSWYDTGEKEYEQVYVAGKFGDVVYRKWHKNGQMSWEWTNLMYTKPKDGHQFTFSYGRGTYWRDNGQKESEFTRDSKLIGTHTSWHLNGTKASITITSPRGEEKRTSWHSNGRLSEDYIYKEVSNYKGLVSYDKDGKPRYSDYKGLWGKSYDENGQITNDGAEPLPSCDY